MASRASVILGLLFLVSNGLLPSCASAKTIYVNCERPDDIGDGLSWETAKKTVQAGMDAAVAGDEVWVAAGTYVQCITLRKETKLYGGFPTGGGPWASRDPSANETVLDGNSSGSVVTCQLGATPATIIDGFTIVNGYKDYGGGICCASASPTISNNTISGNRASSAGGGIYCDGSSLISGNLISQNSPDGIHSGSSASTISGNVVSLNQTAGVAGILGTVSNNRIYGNATGILCSSACTVAGNTIAYNTGDGVTCGVYAVTLTNNTLVGNRAGVSFTGSPARLSNNIIAFNVEGISKDSGATFPTLWRNNVFGNSSVDYDGFPAGPTDISADPQLMSVSHGDFHILPTSPCRDAGDPLAPAVPAEDVDGQPRISGPSVDIGADESYGEPYAGNRVLRVNPAAPPGGDGATWETAFRTLQEAVDDTITNGGAEIWAAAGTYVEKLVLRPFAHLYGGFAGTESGRSQRQPRANTTAVSAGSKAAGDYAITSAHRGTVDGFTISGSYAGVYSSCRDFTLSNNLITDNWFGVQGAVFVGGQTIAGNVFARNGTAIYCEGPATVVNNTISDNSSCGVYSYSGTSRLQLLNNIITFNSYGVYNYSGQPTFSRNDIFGNTRNYTGINAGSTDISADPLFWNAAAMDYRLLPGSPCIDSGASPAAVLGEIDFYGGLRLAGGAIDIGADEFSDPPAPEVTIASAKHRPEEDWVRVTGVITAVFPECFYIQDPQRTCGLRISKPGCSHGTGALVSVMGRLATETCGERSVAASTVELLGTALVAPVAVTNASLGGGAAAGLQQGITNATGLNNIGLLVTTWGRVILTDGSSFVIDDGSGVNAKAIVADGVTVPVVGTYVRVTGISSCERAGSELHRLLRVRGQGGINSQ